MEFDVWVQDKLWEIIVIQIRIRDIKPNNLYLVPFLILRLGKEAHVLVIMGINFKTTATKIFNFKRSNDKGKLFVQVRKNMNLGVNTQKTQPSTMTIEALGSTSDRYLYLQLHLLPPLHALYPQLIPQILQCQEIG